VLALRLAYLRVESGRDDHMGATLGQPPPIGCRSCWPPATTTCWSARTGTVARPTCSPRLPAPLPAGWNGAASGPGAHGERDDDWTAVALDPTGLPDGWGRWLLVRRQTHPGEGKQYRDLAFYRCAGPAATPLRELIQVAGARWAIEECFQAAKTDAGLDHYQVRDYRAWYAHITLRMYMGGWRIIRILGRRISHIETPQGFTADTTSATIILSSTFSGYRCPRPRCARARSLVREPGHGGG
jgi:hypothetical protein